MSFVNSGSLAFAYAHGRHAMMSAIATLSTLLLLCACLPANAGPWDLDSYELCKTIRLRGIDAEASGVTYSYVTNSLWVVTRRPRVLAEYTVGGSLVRTIDTLNAKLRDPEGACLSQAERLPLILVWALGRNFAIGSMCDTL